MEITNTKSQKTLSRDEQQKADLRAKVASKFGNKVLPKTKKDKVEISVKAEKRLEPGDDKFADIGKNDPTKEDTRIKLMGLMKSGGFEFSDKERSALSEILEE